MPLRGRAPRFDMVPTVTPSRNITGGRALRLPPRLACASALRALQAAQEAARAAAAGARSRSSAPTSQPAPQPSGATAPPAAGRRSSAGGSVRKRGHVGALWRGGSGGRRQQCGGRAAAAGTARRCGAAGVGCGFRWVSLVCAFLHAPEETSLSHARAWSTTNCEVRARGCRRDCPVGGRCAHAPSMRCCRQAALPAPITTLRVQW